MNEHYKEVSSRATKGEESALQELFALAEGHEAKCQFQEATAAFREAAIAYKISAFRNLARAEDAERLATWSSAVKEIYQNWIGANPNGLRNLPFPSLGVTRECIRHTVVEELLRDDSFVNLFLFLEDSLTALGLEFYSPGGSIQRRVCQLLEDVFGLGPSGLSEYLSDISVRIGLDTVADEVARRCQSNRP